MSDKELLQLILSEMKEVKSEVKEVREEQSKTREDVGGLRTQVEVLSKSYTLTDDTRGKEIAVLFAKIDDNKKKMDGMLEDYRKRNCPTYSEAMVEFFKSPSAKVIMFGAAIILGAMAFVILLGVKKLFGIDLTKLFGG